MPSFFRNFFSNKTPSHLTSEDADLEKFFTNSDYARQVFESLLSTEHSVKRLLMIHGVGGAGKSTLLKMYRLSCRRQRIPVALVSGEEILSPVDMLANWASDLSTQDVKEATFPVTLTHYRALQAKVEAEAKKSSQAMTQAAEKIGKVAAKTAVEMVASAIPVVGPLAAALGGVGAEALVDWLRGFLSKPDLDLYLDPTQRLTDDFLNDLTRAAAHQRLILLTDTYEQMTTLDDWMRDLARRLPENVLLVIAGRAVPTWDRAWPGWMGRAEIVELKEMTPNDLRLLVRRYYGHIRGGEPDQQQLEAIVQFARGLPIAATTVVQLWVRYGIADFHAVRPQVVADLVDRLLEGVASDMRPAFEAAAILRHFNVETLRVLLDSGDAENLYAELRRWPFIRPRREGLTVHDSVREIINEALDLRSPGHFRALHERVAEYYETKLIGLTGEEADRSGQERLYHRTRANEEMGIRLFQEMAEELTRYRLVNRLRGLLNDVNTYPLRQENSCLWRKYYNARLVYLEGYFDDAREEYIKLSEDSHAEPKLHAYVLCDLGEVLRNLQQHEQAIPFLEKSLSIVPIDSKLILSLAHLRGAFGRIGKFEEALKAIEQMRDYCAESGDKYGLVLALGGLYIFYLNRGYFKEALQVRKQQQENLSLLQVQSLFLTMEFLSAMGFARSWTGQLYKTELDLREALDIAMRLEVINQVYIARDLGYVLGVSGRYKEAEQYFAHSLSASKKITGGSTSIAEQAVAVGFRGAVLKRSGALEEAKKELLSSLAVKNETQDLMGSAEVQMWLGELYEITASFTDSQLSMEELVIAESYFNQSLNLRWVNRRYIECGALTGLIRVKHAQGDYAAVPPLLTEAEQLAQQYEYNDHLASLRLTQGHMSWNIPLPDLPSLTEENGAEVALRYYREALIYAVRYNRFLLDEVLWGSRVATPLRPIIPHCRERGKEGRRILTILRDWWQTGTNNVGTPCLDTISSIPEGILLLEAERLAREQEPGDGSPQQTVIEQIDMALAYQG